MAESPSPRLLVTGASGFVGGRLIDALGPDSGLRCLVRDSRSFEAPDGADVVEADLMEPETLPPALDGIDVAYYLVHSMEPGGGAGFADKDRLSAENFAAAVVECGVRRVIYLGGVSSTAGDSEHLESRTQVEEILRAAVPELVALRASMVVGSGSESFRTMVQLIERLPALLLPSWRESRSQPVAIDDVLGALLAAREVDPGAYDIAGADTLTFERMTRIVGEITGDDPPSFPLPFSSSKLESATASAVVDADRELLEPLMEGLHGDLLVEENALVTTFGIEPTSFEVAARRAIEGMNGARSG